MNAVSTFYSPSTRISARLTLKRIKKAREKAEAEENEARNKKSPAAKRKAQQMIGEGSSVNKQNASADENSNPKQVEVKQEKEETYRSLIQQNIDEKMAFLESLGIDDLKASIVPPPVPVPAKPSSSARRRRTVVEPVAPRKSLRLQNKPAVPLQDTFYQLQEPAEILTGPLEFDKVLTSGMEGEDSRSCLCEGIVKEELCHVTPEPLTKNAERILSRLSDLVADDTTVQKVLPSRITAIAVHPSLTATLVFVGDKLGNFGFVKLGTGENVVETYRPHTCGLMCLKIRPDDPQKIYSASYDDTLRCADIERGIFDELYRCAPDAGVMYFDWMQDKTMIVSHSNGQVSFVDVRAEEKQTGLYNLHDRKVRTIDAHPTNSSWFLTGSTDAKVKLWDSRMMSKKRPIPLAMLTHNRSCSAAFFSPVEGNRIITTSFDDTLKIVNGISPNGEMKQLVSLKHNNYTGRWLSPFKAVWMPGCDELFLVGSMEYPRRIEVYSNHGALLYKLMSESIASVSSLVDVHPERLIVAGGNSSGRVQIFIEP